MLNDLKRILVGFGVLSGAAAVVVGLHTYVASFPLLGAGLFVVLMSWVIGSIVVEGR